MNISLIDDHCLVVQSIADFLRKQPGINEVYTYTRCSEFLEKYNGLFYKPHIIVTDLMMPDMDGLTFITTFKKQHMDGPKIIVLSSISDTQTVKQAFRSGASGFVSKSSTAEEMLAAIHEVNDGKMYLSSNLKDNFISNSLAEEKVSFHLSPREKEVLQKVCSGLTIKEIAHQMKLSKHTVQGYHGQVMQKLKVSRTADLIVFAMQNGLYVPEVNRNL